MRTLQVANRLPITQAMAAPLADNLAAVLAAEGATAISTDGSTIEFQGASREVGGLHPLSVIRRASVQVVPGPKGTTIISNLRFRWARIIPWSLAGVLLWATTFVEPVGPHVRLWILPASALLLALGLGPLVRLRPWLSGLVDRELAHLEYRANNPQLPPPE